MQTVLSVGCTVTEQMVDYGSELLNNMNVECWNDLGKFFLWVCVIIGIYACERYVSQPRSPPYEHNSYSPLRMIVLYTSVHFVARPPTYDEAGDVTTM